MARNSRSGASRSSPGGNERRRRSRSNEGAGGVIGMARERPMAAAAVAAGAAAAGLFLWTKRTQISSQISNLSDQIGEWADTIGSSDAGVLAGISDGPAGVTTKGQRSEARSTARVRSTMDEASGKAGSGSPSSSGTATSNAGGRVRTQPSAPVLD